MTQIRPFTGALLHNIVSIRWYWWEYIILCLDQANKVFDELIVEEKRPSCLDKTDASFPATCTLSERLRAVIYLNEKEKTLNSLKYGSIKKRSTSTYLEVLVQSLQPLSADKYRTIIAETRHRENVCRILKDKITALILNVRGFVHETTGHFLLFELT